MGTQIEKRTEITIGFDVQTFKWFQTIFIKGVQTVYDREVTFEISSEAAKRLLNDLEYEIKPGHTRIDFSIG